MPPPIRREGNGRHEHWGRGSGTVRLRTAGDSPRQPSTRESDRGTSRRGDSAPSTGRPAARGRSLAREGHGWAARPVRRQAQMCRRSPRPQDSPSEMPARSPPVSPQLNKRVPDLLGGRKRSIQGRSWWGGGGVILPGVRTSHGTAREEPRSAGCRQAPPRLGPQAPASSALG